MLLAFCLVFFLLNLTADSQTGHASEAISTSTLGGNASCVLVATPDYPVAEGQAVHLHCSGEPPSSMSSLRCVCQRLQNQTWEVVSNGSGVTLAEPRDSGLYRCAAESASSQSGNHTVFIVAAPPKGADEKLEIAALVFSLLALTVSVGVLFWLGFQNSAATLPIAKTSKGLPASESTPKVRAPQPEDDVYINYTNTHHTYTDLDPTNMTVAGVYSTLS